MKTDLLQELIQSLSKAEKRYFTLYATRYLAEDQNPYILLFRLLDKQKKLSQVIFEKAYGEQITAKKFKNIKSYLNKLVLDSLEGYYKEKDIEIQLSAYYNQGKILLKKGLYKQANNLFQKGITIAKKHGYNHYVAMFQFLQFKNFSLIKINFVKNDLIANTTELYESINKHLTAYREEVAVYSWLNNIYSSIRVDPQYKAKELSTPGAMTTLFQHADLYTTAGQIAHSELLAVVNIQNNQVDEGYWIREKVYQKLQKSGVKDVDNNAYCNFLLNFSVAALRIQKNEKCNELLDIMYAFFQTNHKSDFTISKDSLLRYFIIKIETFIVRQELEKLKQIIKEVKDYIKQYETILNLVLIKVIQQSIAEAYLLLDDYDACLTEINDYWQRYTQETNERSKIRVNFIFIVCHYKLGNDQFLENYIKKLKRKKYEYTSFIVFMKAVEKACKVPDRRAKKEIFRTLKKYLQEEYKENLYELGKLIVWVDRLC